MITRTLNGANLPAKRVLSVLLVFVATVMFLPQFAHSSPSSGQTHAPIFINGNNGFTADNGVTGAVVLVPTPTSSRTGS
ncbi:MAG: hypothetical protein AUF79_10215 [Crenarchaeota archaeon 13_1_20CM_2_51_8]|nr:MAG: hypothetical protein AUF79_10215 [Crenarchaeota archaeon 13_1_20CM_2_51_8]